jgi:molybdopterin converting factor small subunit
MKIYVSLYYNLKEKTGTGNLVLEMDGFSTVKQLKQKLEINYPGLRTQLDKVMMLMDGKIVVDEDQLRENATVSFLPPIGGG